MLLPHYQKFYFFFLSTNQSGSIEGRNRQSPQAPALHTARAGGGSCRSHHHQQGRNQAFQPLPKAAHFPPQYENIHLCHSAAMHLVCFFKKKKSVVCISHPLKFQERKMKGHFVFKTLACGCLMQMKMCSADSDSRVGEATWKEPGDLRHSGRWSQCKRLVSLRWRVSIAKAKAPERGVAPEDHLPSPAQGSLGCC